MTQCPNCGAGLRPDAARCVKCGSVLRDAASVVQTAPPPPPPVATGGDPLRRELYGDPGSPLVAGALSLVLPGVGQLYNGQLAKAVAFFVLGLLNGPLWIFCGLGLVFHVIAAVEAYRSAAAANRRIAS